jgi:hypothetical protein
MLGQRGKEEFSSGFVCVGFSVCMLAMAALDFDRKHTP